MAPLSSNCRPGPSALQPQRVRLLAMHLRSRRQRGIRHSQGPLSGNCRLGLTALLPESSLVSIHHLVSKRASPKRSPHGMQQSSVLHSSPCRVGLTTLRTCLLALLLRSKRRRGIRHRIGRLRGRGSRPVGMKLGTQPMSLRQGTQPGLMFPHSQRAGVQQPVLQHSLRRRRLGERQQRCRAGARRLLHCRARPHLRRDMRLKPVGLPHSCKLQCCNQILKNSGGYRTE
mmetsp:Transcript_68717/g.126664  ORF Transcript_68717/g.126664 Transcript_68717/m.126664 type:complete len:229 (-) Transcript_68717:88-774(-)